jgi:hypothetical protein
MDQTKRWEPSEIKPYVARLKSRDIALLIRRADAGRDGSRSTGKTQNG